MQAYFIFEKAMTDLAHKKDVYGELQSVLNVISVLPVNANGQVELDDDISSKVKDLNIKFYGDMVLPQNPTTFEEAVKIYKELPSFVTGQNAHSVPVKVYLAPLEKLDRLGVFAEIHEISKSLISNVVTIMQEFQDAKEEAQDLSRSIAARDFNFIDRKVDRFLNLLRQYTQKFQGHIAPLLVQIRGSGTEESVLSSYLQNHFNSPFSKFNLEFWIQQIRQETLVLETFVNLLRNVTFCKNQGEYIQQMLTNDQIISLNMYFPEISDPALDRMGNFLEGLNSTHAKNVNLWFHNRPTIRDFRSAINNFLDYKEANDEDPGIKFIYTLLPSSNPARHFPHTEIKALDDNFSPPGPPIAIRETITNDTVSVHWEHLQQDYIDHYEITVQQRGNQNSEEVTQFRYQTESIETEFQIVIPDSSIPYDVYVNGVCQIGRTASSAVLHHSGITVRLIGGAEICNTRRAYSGRVEVR